MYLWLIKLDQRWGSWSVPLLLHGLTIIHVVLFIMTYAQPEITQRLTLDGSLILTQPWRLLTGFLLPTAMNPLLFLLGCFFLPWIGRVMIEDWSSLRMNLYVLGLMGLIILSALIMQRPVAASWALSTGLLLVMGRLRPQAIVMLFFVIPVKMWFSALLTAVYLVVMFVSGPMQNLDALATALPFIAVFGPGFPAWVKQEFARGRHWSRAQKRKMPAVAFHRCHVCQKTEEDDKALEFRVATDGEEYCDKCLPQAKAAS